MFATVGQRSNLIALLRSEKQEEGRRKTACKLLCWSAVLCQKTPDVAVMVGSAESWWAPSQGKQLKLAVLWLVHYRYFVGAAVC